MDPRTSTKDLKQEPGIGHWRGKNRARFVYGIEKLEDRVNLGERGAREEESRSFLDICLGN